MVKLEEVDDVDLFEEEEDDSENYTDDEDLSDDDLEGADEGLLDRIYALKDIVPLKQRQTLSNTMFKVYSWSQTGFRFVSKSAWVLTTSMLLLVLPLALEIEKEQALITFENDVKMQQQGTQQLATPNIYGQPAQQDQPAKAIVPPGF